MPGTGHKAWLYLSDDAIYTTVTAIECQTGLSINQTAEQIDLSHKNSDVKIFGVATNTITIPFAGRIEIAAEQGNPTDLAAQLALLDTAFQGGTTVYVEVRLSLIKGTVLATADRFRRYSGVISTYSWDFPDEESATYTGEIAARSIELL